MYANLTGIHCKYTASKLWGKYRLSFHVDVIDLFAQKSQRMGLANKI